MYDRGACHETGRTVGSPAKAAGPSGTGGLASNLRWFAAEIVVVVAGALLALAINAWWGARQQAQEEQRLLAALLDEFTADRERPALGRSTPGSLDELPG